MISSELRTREHKTRKVISMAILWVVFGAEWRPTSSNESLQSIQPFIRGESPW